MLINILARHRTEVFERFAGFTAYGRRFGIRAGGAPRIGECKERSPQSPFFIRQELCAVPFDQEDSFVRVPTGPGLGIEVDEGVVERLRTSWRP